MVCIFSVVRGPQPLMMLFDFCDTTKLSNLKSMESFYSVRVSMLRTSANISQGRTDCFMLAFSYAWGHLRY